MSRVARTLPWALLLIGLAAFPAVAQRRYPAAPAGTTLQLPTFAFTSATTTVSVPDQGEVFLGGIKRSALQSSSRGVPVLGKLPGPGRLFRNRGISREQGALNMSVRAQIIDLNELDEQILAEAQRRTAQRGPSGLERIAEERRGEHDRADFLTRNIARNPVAKPSDATPTPPPAPAIDVAARLKQAERERAAEAQKYYDDARDAAARGKLSVARIYLEMAARRCEGEQKQHVLAQLQLVRETMAAKP